MTSLNVSRNHIQGAEAGKALGNALAAHTVLKQLDLTKNLIGVEFTNEFVAGLRVNGSLTSLNVGINRIPIKTMYALMALVERKPAMKILCAVPFRDKSIADLDVRGQRLGAEGGLVVHRYLLEKQLAVALFPERK